MDHPPRVKLSTSEESVRDQPSTMTNIRSFIGSDIIIGDNIIMPSDIKILATTISITRNGKYSKTRW